MTQQTAEKLNRKIFNLKKEMKILRSFVIGAIIKDKEGEYRPEFVKKILRLSKEKRGFDFRNAKIFLKQIQKSL